MSTSSPAIRARSYYLPATDTVGSRIRVKWQGRQYTEPFDYTSSNVHRSAVAHALGVDPDDVKYVDERDATLIYEVRCIHPEDNHSDDLTLLAHGRATRLPLCGYHASRFDTSMADALRA